MQTYPTSQARGKLGKLLKQAQWDEVPFTVRLRQDPACVGAPHTWFKRACTALGEKPDVKEAPPVFDELRLALGDLAADVMHNGAFYSVMRLSGPACFLVPVPWYETCVELVGPPAGDTGGESGTGGEGEASRA